ncbi:hypothetical protein O181_111282, partial [Austropuccinia psidii MF-1]|nr:hypothetical protein [Austropuccinia psidii MF-1]
MSVKRNMDPISSVKRQTTAYLTGKVSLQDNPKKELGPPAPFPKNNSAYPPILLSKGFPLTPSESKVIRI